MKKQKGCLNEMIEYDNPVQIEFGAGSLKFLPRFLKGRRALLVTSKSFVTRGQVDLLIKSNPSILSVISDIMPNPTLEHLLAYRKHLKYEEFDVIIALGGGSVIDISKAFSVYNGLEDLDIKRAVVEGLHDVEFHTKPIIAIPTTAGTGSEVTQWGTIWDDVNKKKYSISHPRLYCEAAILDPELHITIPEELTIQTGLDALSHSLESIWNKNSNPISELYAKTAAKTVLEVLPKLVKDLNNIELREKMLIASYQAGLAFSNTQTAIAHAMSYYMTLHKGIPHGIAASITLPTILEVYIEQKSSEKDDFMNDELLSYLLDIFRELKIDLTLNNYGLSKLDFERIFAELNSNVRAKNSTVNQELLFTKLVNH